MARVAMRVYHKPKRIRGKWVPYAYGCTESAILRAKKLGKNAIDLDGTIDAEGVLWANHSNQLIKKDAWFDPLGVHRSEARIHLLPTDTLRRFTSRYGDLLSMWQAVRVCKRVGITPCIEMKHDPLGRDRDVEFYKAQKRKYDRQGVDPIIMTLPSAGKGIKRLAAAKEAGFRTMWLWRGPIPASYHQHITYIKSRPGRGIYTP